MIWSAVVRRVPWLDSRKRSTADGSNLTARSTAAVLSESESEHRRFGPEMTRPDLLALPFPSLPEHRFGVFADH